MALLLPRFPEGLRRFFATLGEGGPIELADEVFATQPLPSDQLLEAPLGIVRWAARGVAAAGGAGVRSGTSVVNPTNSSHLVVVERILVESTAIVIMQPFRTVQANYAVAVTGVPQDTRLRRQLPADTFTGLAIAQIFNKTAGAATGATTVYTGATLAQGLEIKLGWVLIPGSQLAIEHTTDNNAIGVTFFGYDRHVRTEELVIS